MKHSLSLLALISSILLNNSHNINGKLFDTRNELLSRQRRSLIWLEGINWVQIIVGIGLPIELKDQSITVGTVVKAFYLLPTNASDYTHPSIDFARKKRSATRWTTYKLLESFFVRYGQNDGKACLLKSICEYSAKPFDPKAGILAEIAHAVLTPSTTRDNLDQHADTEYHAAEKLGKEADCSRLFPECTFSFIQQFSQFY